MPKVLSFDVGIKNLAFCLFSYDPDQDQIQIIQWDILNLMPSAPGSADNAITQRTCNQCCKKSAYITPENIPQVLCEKHAQLSPFYKPLLNLQKKTREELQQIISEKQQVLFKQKVLKKSGKKDIPQNTTLQMPVVNGETKTAFLEHIKQKLLKKRKPVLKTQDIGLVEIGRRINHLFSSGNIPLDGITHVLIENQISTIASRMKTIQGMLAQFFIMRIPEAHIEFISSHNKGSLQIRTALPGETPLQTVYSTQTNRKAKEGSVENTEDVPTKSGYAENKKRSVDLVKEICPEEQQAFFLSHKKKDDLADCFLQGVWFVKVKNK